MVKKGLPGGAGQVGGSARADGYSGSSCQHQRASVDDREATEVAHAGGAVLFMMVRHREATTQALLDRAGLDRTHLGAQRVLGRLD